VRDERGTSRGEAIAHPRVGMGIDAPTVEMDDPTVDVDTVGGRRGVVIATKQRTGG
jgi:hypothetical protein